MNFVKAFETIDTHFSIGIVVNVELWVFGDITFQCIDMIDQIFIYILPHCVICKYPERNSLFMRREIYARRNNG